MKKNFLLSLILCLALSVTSIDSFAAKRFGGGGSFGRAAPTFTQKTPSSAPGFAQKSPSQQQAPSKQQVPNKQTTPNQQPQKPSMLKGILGGVLAALGISALLSALGLDPSGFAGIFMLIILAGMLFMVARMFFARKISSQGASARVSAEQNDTTWSNTTKSSSESSQTVSDNREYERMRAGAAADSVMARFNRKVQQEQTESDAELASFDSKSFVDVARTQFQKFTVCWVENRMEALADFMSQEVFIELTHARRQLGSIGQLESIDPLNAEFVGIVKEGGEYIASVRFIGHMVIDSEGEDFDETWVLTKPVDGTGGWVLSGIQQN